MHRSGAVLSDRSDFTEKDKETDQSEAQGAATLEDAQFSIKYYSGYYEKIRQIQE